jgi:hypothetical protein
VEASSALFCFISLSDSIVLPQVITLPLTGGKRNRGVHWAFKRPIYYLIYSSIIPAAGKKQTPAGSKKKGGDSLHPF